MTDGVKKNEVRTLRIRNIPLQKGVKIPFQYVFMDVTVIICLKHKDNHIKRSSAPWNLKPFDASTCSALWTHKIFLRIHGSMIMWVSSPSEAFFVKVFGEASFSYFNVSWFKEIEAKQPVSLLNPLQVLSADMTNCLSDSSVMPKSTCTIYKP